MISDYSHPDIVSLIFGKEGTMVIINQIILKNKVKDIVIYHY